MMIMMMMIRGLIHLEEAYILEIVKLNKYVDSTAEPLIRIVRTRKNRTKSTMLHNDRNLKEKLHKRTRQVRNIKTAKMKQR